MSQHDYNIANQTFPATRTDLNNALGAIATNNAGNSQPATTYPNQWWFDSDGDQLYIRNKDNDAWVKVFKIGATSDLITEIATDSLILGGTTPTLTIGDGGAEDAKILFDGNAQNFHIGLDDSTDKLTIGLGNALGTYPAITIDENTNVVIPDSSLSVIGSGNYDILTITSTDADANSGPVVVLKRDSGSPADGDETGKISFTADDDGGNSTEFANIASGIADASNSSEDGALTFNLMSGGSAVELLRLEGSKGLVFNEGSADTDFRVESNGNANMLFVNGGDDAVGIGTNVTNSRRLVIGTGGAKTATSTHYVMNIGQTNEASSHAGLGVYFVGGASAAVRKFQFQPVENGVANDGIIEFCPNGGKTAFFGNVGIGTSSPADMLDISGTNPNIAFIETDQSNKTYKIGSFGSAFAVYDGTAGAFRLTILTDGSLAIKSTTTDNASLKVQQDTADKLIARFEHHNGSGNNYGLRIEHKGQAPDNNTSDFLVCGDTGASRMIIYSDGDIQNHDNAYGAISDERIKQDIRDSNSQWNDIKAVKVRNFKKKDDVRQYGDNAWEQIGVVAQELEAVSPKLIRHNNPTSHDILSDSSFGTLWTADDPETQDAVEEVLYTADDPETQDVLYTADDELPEGVKIGDVKTQASHNVGDVKIEAKPSTEQIGEVKEINEQVKSVNYSILYMKAIKALQEAMDRIETLESKVATLEGE